MTSPTVHIVEAATPEQIAAIRELFREYARSLGQDEAECWLADALYTETAPYRDDMPYPEIRWMRKELGAHPG